MNFSFHHQFLFRTPALPFIAASETYETIKKVAQDDFFGEAIYIASPILYQEMQKWFNGRIKEVKEVRKLVYSLHKYLSRMQSRCTPYGLFASCSVGQWSKENIISLTNALTPYCRYDMDFVCTLSRSLIKHPHIFPNILFYPNNSIYYVGDAIRFVQYKYIDNRRKYAITSAATSEYLLKVLELAKRGALYSEFCAMLVQDSIPMQDAENYIHQIIDSQLLVSELEPNVTGREYFYELTDKIEKINEKTKSEEISSILEVLKKEKEKNNIKNYRQVFEQLKVIFPETKENTLFQIDSFKSASKAVLNDEIQNQIVKALEFLTKFATPFSNNNLNEFKKRFIENYEGQEMPLLQVLDVETGIGYPAKDTVGVNELVDDLVFQTAQPESQIKWNNREDFLLQKLLEAAKKDSYTVSFSLQDLKDWENKGVILPPTMSVLFQVIDKSKNKIQFVNATGSSAANFLGRFAHGSEEILKVVKDITQFEKAILSDKIIAEIVHLPESRLGNILLRPVIRDYEIPYLAQATVESEFQIPLNDLMVSVHNNRIVLRSIRLNREVLPRLTSMHNYSFNALPAYKFLCDMQQQDVNLPGIMFNWGSLSRNFKFLPRAELENTILNPATWNLSKQDYEPLFKNLYTEGLMDKVKEWQKQWKMPRYITLNDSDNELLIDLTSELSVKVFLDTIKKRPFIELSEFLFEPENALIKDESGRSYNNEIVALLFNKEYEKSQENRTIAIENLKLSDKIKRSFIPGSEWLYYKIYCGVKTADTILTQTIKPLTEQLISLNLIKKWFFIRYSDPDTHIRLRLLCTDTNKIGEIINIACQFFEPFLQQGLISKILQDTYQREIERYGNTTIEISEDIFMYDSIAALKLLSFAESEKNENLLWLYAARNTDNLISNFKYESADKLKITERLREGFFTEHGGQKDLKLQLDGKFRKLRPQLESFLMKKQDNDINLLELLSILNWKNDYFQLLIDKILKIKEEGNLNVDVLQLISSYSHMSMNRIFKSKQRTYELVIYDMLQRFIKSQNARNDKLPFTSREFRMKK